MYFKNIAYLDLFEAKLEKPYVGEKFFGKREKKLCGFFKAFYLFSQRFLFQFCELVIVGFEGL